MFGRVWEWIVGVFRKRSVKPKPAKFSRHEGLKSNRWMLTIPGIDAYCVRSVKLPIVKPGPRKGLNPVLSQLTLDVFTNVDASSAENVLTWVNQSDRRKIELKYLTSHGKIAEQWTMVGVPIEFKTTDLDYSTSSLVTVTIKIQLFSIDIRSFNVTD